METATVELTKAEAQLIVQFLQTANVTGNMATLPKLLMQVTEIVQKIEKAFTEN